VTGVTRCVLVLRRRPSHRYECSGKPRRHSSRSQHRPGRSSRAQVSVSRQRTIFTTPKLRPLGTGATLPAQPVSRTPSPPACGSGLNSSPSRPSLLACNSTPPRRPSRRQAFHFLNLLMCSASKSRMVLAGYLWCRMLAASPILTVPTHLPMTSSHMQYSLAHVAPIRRTGVPNHSLRRPNATRNAKRIA
jgi:hypothetical protein